MLSGLLFLDASVLGLQRMDFIVSSYGLLSVPVHSGISSSSYKNTGPVGLGLHPYDFI